MEAMSKGWAQMSATQVIKSQTLATQTQLSERDAAIIDFERNWWQFAGAKESAIRETFDLSSTRYYQILNGLIDSPQALAFDPMLVKRLRRMRASRQRARSAGPGGLRR